MKVTLRTKPMTDGRQSLYLDFYPPILHPATGKPTRREFLKLYVFAKPRNEFDKNHNAETRMLANSIRAKRQLSIQAGNYGFLIEDRKQGDFLAYFKALAEKHKAMGKGDKNNWLSVYNYFAIFTKNQCKFCDLTESRCNEFKEFLLNAPTFRRTKMRLTRNSAGGYFVIFKTVLRKAYKEKYITEPLFDLVTSIKKLEAQREYLTGEELKKLANANCDLPVLKRAAMFSAFTGLRYSDVAKLTWREIVETEVGYSIRFTQKKTQQIETHPINRNAVSFLGSRGPADEKIFTGLLYSSWQNMKIQQWIARAGIAKEITFHCFRHSYAMLQLEHGTDVYTLSGMLGHRSLKTTQIYTRITDKRKRDAAESITMEL